ncbi:ABC transporter permease [Brevibacillus ruminantium]|uniref:ABC transporter permease n=1 Tax=Brevibacillus ruminantium TaxID=2950604 RepID=A0ABY4WEP9_9BACL|nr:ABC transporter permease [Brevibacillus ruminantium]USG65630.1 ABC transporter permease [Brevibacillus ruminantium]
MFTLMKLEYKKMKLRWYVSGAVLANLIIVGFLCLIGFVQNLEGEMIFTGYEESLVIIGALVRSTFMIFAAVLIARLVIGGYRNKTIFLMFTYPISRKKLIAAKLMLIAGLTFLTIFLSNLFVAAMFISLNTWFQFIPGEFPADRIGEQVASMIVFAIGAAGTSLIPLYFGMRKYSVPATIVSAVLIVTLTTQNSPGFSLASIVYIPLALAVVGIFISYWSIRQVEEADIV